ncbi:O-Methyltransferase involved in polyketide biosynthesis [Streptomyces zhaozhouensis]|uniref:O-Methyltransferase involved in polyketide biosynthesis n=1 Tax=Streptomyces zhaozhouensis TaxID=1300267 RepID=A0A286DWP0_9ACTN|nr:class I SAM-dependent methyltransferase [Streptomyces zhaozhouensis]SOD62974.1 O-Methyltransferase involved in polyketide biosynthesis [Streptomyces zhaozhouensis]
MSHDASHPPTRPSLGAVQETLLIPLYGRAVEHRRPDAALTDPRAAELVDALDYDFARFAELPSLTGSVLRTLLFDHWTRDFLGDHPAGTVVEIGAGLNTRFERTDNGRARWFELDLPDVAALRGAFFAETPRRTTLATSVTEPDWLEEVGREPGGARLFAAEAVLPFLPEAEVRALVGRIARRLPGTLLALDTHTPRLVADQDAHDALSRTDARLRWGCADIEVVADWAPGSRVLASHTLTSLPRAVHDALPPRHRALLDDLARRRLPQVEEYRMHLLRLP